MLASKSEEILPGTEAHLATGTPILFPTTMSG